MADVEVRCFGWRFLFVLNRTEPTQATEPEARDHLNGSFDPANGPYYDGRAVDMGFRAR